MYEMKRLEFKKDTGRMIERYEKRPHSKEMLLTAGWPYDYSFMKLRVILRITGAVRAKGRSQSLQG